MPPLLRQRLMPPLRLRLMALLGRRSGDADGQPATTGTVQALPAGERRRQRQSDAATFFDDGRQMARSGALDWRPLGRDDRVLLVMPGLDGVRRPPSHRLRLRRPPAHRPPAHRPPSHRRPLGWPVVLLARAALLPTPPSAALPACVHAIADAALPAGDGRSPWPLVVAATPAGLPHFVVELAGRVGPSAGLWLVPQAVGDRSQRLQGLQAAPGLVVARDDALRAARQADASLAPQPVTPLYSEPRLAIVRADSPPTHLQQLRGQRVPGGGGRPGGPVPPAGAGARAPGRPARVARRPADAGGGWGRRWHGGGRAGGGRADAGRADVGRGVVSGRLRSFCHIRRIRRIRRIQRGRR